MLYLKSGGCTKSKKKEEEEEEEEEEDCVGKNHQPASPIHIEIFSAFLQEVHK